MDEVLETVDVKDSESESETELKGISTIQEPNDETPGTSKSVLGPEIIELDDTSNSSSVADSASVKPIITEPDEIRPSGFKTSHDIIEITDPTGDNFEVEFVESIEERSKGITDPLATDVSKDKIPEPNKSITEVANETVIKAVNKMVTDTFSENIAKDSVNMTVNETITDKYETIGETINTTNKTVNDTVDKTVSDIVNKTINDTIDKTVTEPVEETVHEIVDPTVHRSVTETVYETGDESVTETSYRTENIIKVDKASAVSPKDESIVLNETVPTSMQVPSHIEREIAALAIDTDGVDKENAINEQLLVGTSVNGIDDTLIISEDTKGTNLSDSSSIESQVSKIVVQTTGTGKTVKLPSHLIGHDLEKPVECVKNGKVTVKPRLGVKVPYRNLTSQIVSKQEITEEIMERSRLRQASSEPPSGNVLFAKKLTSRLARKLSPSNKSKYNTEITTAATSSLAVPSPDRIANNSDLIALLEGDDDTDWNLISTKKSPIKTPEWEKETALKQLQQLPKMGKKDLDDTEPRLSLNPVIKTYTRKRKPSEDIKAILEGTKKPTLPSNVSKGGSASSALKSSVTPQKSETASTPHKTISQKITQTPPKSANTPKVGASYKQTPHVSTPKTSAGEQKPNVKTPVSPKKSGLKSVKIDMQKASTPGGQKVLTPVLQKVSTDSGQKLSTPNIQKLTSNTGPRHLVGPKSVMEAQRSSQSLQKAAEQKPQSPQKITKSSSSIQKSIQNIRKLSATSTALPPHVKLSTDRKAIIILTPTLSDEEDKKSVSSNHSSPDASENNSNIATPLNKKILAPNTYISKSLRIVKRKKIWDPDEATPTKLVRLPRPSEPEVETKVTVEKQTAKKIIKKAIAKKKVKPKRLTEIDKLLMDEGAINLLYSVKNMEPVKKKMKSVISLDKAERELMNRTNEIKNDLMQTTSVTGDTAIGLRKKPGPKYVFKDPAAIILQRKKSKDSIDGSVHTHTPPASPAYAYHANVSRLIRRHSSSSFTSKDSEDDEDEVDEEEEVDDDKDEDYIKPKASVKKQKENLLKNSNVNIENNATNELIDDSEYTEFKTFNVRKFDKLVQIILVPSSPNAHITLTLPALNELTEILELLQVDNACHVVVVSSAGNSFCLGIDYREIQAPTMKETKSIATQYATAVRTFLLALSRFPKLIVAGVHGNAVGLGVTMLPLFDMVLASDTATFSTPYTNLGCAAEGGVLLKLPHVMHNALAGELFFASRKLTAAEAFRLGLVTRTLWPDKFQEELISVLKIVSSQSLQSMEAIKKQLRHQLLTNVEVSLKAESVILIQLWTSNECQKNFVKYSLESK